MTPVAVTGPATPDTIPSTPQRNKYSNEGNAKRGGDISDAFASMSSAAGCKPGELPERYISLKNELVPTESAKKSLVKAWNEVLASLRDAVEEIKEKGGKVRILGISIVYGLVLRGSGSIVIDYTSSPICVYCEWYCHIRRARSYQESGLSHH